MFTQETLYFSYEELHRLKKYLGLNSWCTVFVFENAYKCFTFCKSMHNERVCQLFKWAANYASSW